MKGKERVFGVSGRYGFFSSSKENCWFCITPEQVTKASHFRHISPELSLHMMQNAPVSMVIITVTIVTGTDAMDTSCSMAAILKGQMVCTPGLESTVYNKLQ